MKVLFWNTHKNVNINTLLSEIITENNVTIVALAEYTADMDELIDALAVSGIKMKKYSDFCDRIKLLGSLESVEQPIFDNSHFTIKIINDKDILCCVHLNSQLYSGHDEFREILMHEIIIEIERIEKEYHTKNTMIVGDFNMNPFDSSCIDARYFHGISVYDEAKRNSRTIAGTQYNIFYNPMWNFLGDFQKPYGTYYYDKAGVKNTYWNIFDQVIFRPSLMERFAKDNLKIITETKENCLLDNKGHPNTKISDHLPILFEMRDI